MTHPAHRTRNSPRAPLLTLLLALAAALAPAAVDAQETAMRGTDPGIARLARELGRLAGTSGGVMGVGALHLESGRSVILNGSERFPMASSYKVPIAVQLLTRVDAGEIRLDSMVTIGAGDIHPGSGMLSELLDDPGVALSLRNLLELMLLISDNSATDVVLRTAGGGAAVTARMRALGAGDIRVDRPTVGLIGDFVGARGLPADGNVTIEQYRAAARAVTRAGRDSAAAAFDRDPRDTATPGAMLGLLETVWRGDALSRESTALLLDIMTRSTTGTGRIRGMLPSDVAVAHKTGTIGGTTNDVGILTLPDGAGQVAVVVFVKASTLPVEQRERAIAQVSRAIYDYFVFNPAPAAAREPRRGVSTCETGWSARCACAI
jgi:beta-lactamase class A